jgi:hypothetical protein
MTDEKFIENFLNRHYSVILDNLDVMVTENDTKHKYRFDFFVTHRFNVIIGNYYIDDKRSSFDVVRAWFLSLKEKLTQDLYDYLQVNGSKYSATAGLKVILKKFGNKNKYSEDFITGYFHSYYNEYVIAPRVEKYLKNYQSGIKYQELSENFDKELSLDTYKQVEYAKDLLYKWYSENVINDKVKEFFKELVITMGPRNWVVSWIGHGPLTKEKMHKYFIGESEIIYEFIENAYDEWYAEAVVLASERYISSNSGF